ncbi:MAG TPA: DUF1360 domain-containing protein [Streptosporangiaceae bacterium]
MTVLTDLRDRISGAAHQEGARYAAGHDRPLRGYAATMGTYGLVVGALAAAARLARPDIPDKLPVTDIALSAVATHKLSRLLARDPVTSPLRAPFTTYRGTAGPAELAEDVRGSGASKTVGELITCPFCIGVWVATGLTAGLVFLPRTTRLVTGTLTALSGADLLQYGHALLDQATS